MTEKQDLKRWQLDCSARFYPVMTTKKSQSLFGMHVKLETEVDKIALEKAANAVAPMYPTICASIKRGFFWHYIQQNLEPIKISPLPKSPLLPIPKEENNGHCFRLCAEGDEIWLEMFHAMTDGTGALDFFKAVLSKYGEFVGNIDDAALVDKSGDKYTEDAFFQNAQKTSPGFGSLIGGAPHLNRAPSLKGGYKTDSFVTDADSLVAAAKSRGVSVTAYMSGVVAYAIESVAKNTKPLAIMVPVNLRQLFPSETIRNFTMFVRLSFDPKKYSGVGDYIAAANEQLKNRVNVDDMQSAINTTVRGIRMINRVPLFVKAFFARLGRMFMRSRQTLILSNLGRVQIDSRVGVKSFRLQMNVSKNNALNLGVLSYNGEICATFTRACEDREIIVAAMSALESDGIKVEQVR